MSEEIKNAIEADIRKLVNTRYNEVTGRIEYVLVGNDTYAPLTDRVERTILRELKSLGHMKLSVEAVRNILQSDFSPAYNPFLEYFESLPEWDASEDPIADLCDLLQVENDEYFIPWFTKWLTITVASALSVDIVNQQMMVFSGGQGIGKTTFFEKLVPKQLLNYFVTGYLNPENKDAQIHACECLLVNMDELSSLSTKNVEAFKQLLSQKTIRIRRPYGTNAETLTRRASFCGSTNNDQFLLDHTGSRRFLCFKVTEIDLEKLLTVDIDKVYAQAYALCKSGSIKLYFNKKENQLIEENNQGFQVQSTEEEAILSMFEPCDPDDWGVHVFKWAAMDIMNRLAEFHLVSRGNGSAQKIGIALKKLGYHSYKSNGRTLYKVRLKQS